MAKEGAGNKWVKVDLTAPPDLADALANFLTEIGAEGICQEAPAPPADEFEADPIFDTLTAYFPGEKLEPAIASLETYLEGLHDIFPAFGKPTFAITQISDADWGEEWKKYFHPLRIGNNLIVKPTWEPYTAAAGDVVIEIDPGMAFGTGQHHSTAMCLEAMESLITEQLTAAERVLDVGTGTGILGIAAARLGARDVLCLDIDEQAVAIAIENAFLNQVAARLKIRHSGIAALRETFDLILANLTAKLLIEIYADLESGLRPGGYLILSGIIEKQSPEIEKQFSHPPLRLHRLVKSADWRCYVYCKE